MGQAGKHSADVRARAKELAKTILKKDGSPNGTEIGRLLGICERTVRHWLQHPNEEPKLEFPKFVIEGDEVPPIEEILDRFHKHHEREKKNAEAREWFPIKVKEDRPYAFLWFGDPHLGAHCDWDELDRCLLVARQDGIYGANIGDTTDNWPWTGRLARLWAEEDISNKTERRLAEWFMFDAGVDWALWLGGNHDEWQGGFEFYKRLGAYNIPVMDWCAQFRLVHKNGDIRIDAAHGRKGNSIYNPTHGTLRAAKFGEHAHMFVTGHTHDYGVFDIEFSERKAQTWLVQISGFKTRDRHAKVHGFGESKRGAAVLSIFFPETGKVQCFADIEYGADYLRFLRK